MKYLEIIVDYFGKQSKRVRYFYAIIVLAASGVLFWSARTATHFLGDSFFLLSYLKDMSSKEFFLFPYNHGPLTTFIVFKLNQLFSALGSVDSAESAYHAYSISSGIAFIAIIWKLTNYISKERVERVLLFLFLFASGASQLFFGYVENYALAYVVFFLFILVSVSYLQRVTSIILPIIIFPLLVATYFATIIILPALLMLIWVSIQRKEIKATVFAFIGSVIIAIALMWMLGYTPTFISKVLEEARNPTVPRIVPLIENSTKYQQYAFFSIGHATDLLNLSFLVQPTALVLLFAGRWLRQKQENKTHEKIFLVLMMFCGIAFIFSANSELGMSRDWDALAALSGGISVTAVYGWFYEIKESRIRRELLAAITIVALLQTGLWIGINANETSAVQRIDLLLEDPHWTAKSICYVAEPLGNLYWARKQYTEAAKCYERGAALEPSNPRFLSQLALMYIALRENSKAIEVYKRMDSIGCVDAKIYSNLGTLYLKSQQYDNALKFLYKAEALDSISPHIPLHIGSAIAICENSYKKALPYFLRAIKLDPFYSLAYYNASLCYRDMGDTVMAFKYYKRFTELNKVQP